MQRTDQGRPSRRDLMKAMGMATLAVPASAWRKPAHAQSTAAPAATDVITRTIPRTGEAIPIVGLGTFLAFDTIPGQNRDHLGQVLQRYWEAGSRLVDTSPLYGTGEITVGDFATGLGIGDQLFVANKIWSTGDFLADDSHALRSLELSEGRLWRQRLDLVQCHSLVNVDFVVPLLRAWKKEGRIRYTGVTHFENAYLTPLADWVERGDLDFVQVHYSIFNRRAEERVLPAAADRGIAVLTNMPFEKARLFKLVEGRPLPDLAREIEAANWAQFFLKWAAAHPAVTCVLAATADPDHLAENVGALRGPLPDARMRARMVRHMETIPGFDQIGRMPWYPDKRYPGIIARSQAELRARS